jgi:hypothetical protein
MSAKGSFSGGEETVIELNDLYGNVQSYSRLFGAGREQMEKSMMACTTWSVGALFGCGRSLRGKIIIKNGEKKLEIEEKKLYWLLKNIAVAGFFSQERPVWTAFEEGELVYDGANLSFFGCLCLSAHDVTGSVNWNGASATANDSHRKVQDYSFPNCSCTQNLYCESHQPKTLNPIQEYVQMSGGVFVLASQMITLQYKLMAGSMPLYCGKMAKMIKESHMVLDKELTAGAIDHVSFEGLTLSQMMGSDEITVYGASDNNSNTSYPCFGFVYDEKECNFVASGDNVTTTSPGSCPSEIPMPSVAPSLRIASKGHGEFFFEDPNEKWHIEQSVKGRVYSSLREFLAQQCMIAAMAYPAKVTRLTDKDEWPGGYYVYGGDKRVIMLNNHAGSTAFVTTIMGPPLMTPMLKLPKEETAEVIAKYGYGVPYKGLYTGKMNPNVIKDNGNAAYEGWTSTNLSYDVRDLMPWDIAIARKIITCYDHPSIYRTREYARKYTSKNLKFLGIYGSTTTEPTVLGGVYFVVLVERCYGGWLMRGLAEMEWNHHSFLSKKIIDRSMRKVK